MLRRANELGARGHVAAAATFAAGGSEYDIHQAFLGAIDQREQELPYNAIVALNEAGSVLHYQNLRREAPAAHTTPCSLMPVRNGTGYASDITRTMAGGDANRGQRGLCRTDQGHGPARSSPCARRCGRACSGSDIHLAAHRAVAAVLRDAGLISCDADEAVASGLSRRVPAAWHRSSAGTAGARCGRLAAFRGRRARSRGRPGHPYLRLTRRLEAGFVVTDGAGAVLHRARCSRRRVRMRARAHINWRTGGKPAPLRRHPHRG